MFSLARSRRVEPVDGAISGEICAGQGTAGSCAALAGWGRGGGIQDCSGQKQQRKAEN
ncbi:uncharacterized protein EURHEDRAFT_415310 [Aspergillus ruber CBS 135680]|uniref:Uncharacterized protein n=1 Tax=Aspergillus ruber (strain CBS 135680) TaxID=1388766 RepID=A0A017S6W3_ASPRC|nr:uncharacterized protein EURHEDRAFT_415310 [Aspergillus ruber CBS 135680]EYE92546.1 hypothetical protein EURHEDRAFT_415310 [Aspergillus ruber CBS 135680]